MKKIVFLFAIFVQFCCLTVQAKHFEDVPYGYWGFQAIDRMTDEGIIGEDFQGIFMPERNITRAEYAEGIIKVIKQQDRHVENIYSFEDIDNSHPKWSYVIRALDLEIMKPVSANTFCPEDFVTRTEIITFLVNILRSESITKQEALNTLFNAYVDYDDVPDWFKVTAGKAEVMGIIAKEPQRENYLDYDEYITKAQFAYFLDAFKQKLEEYELEDNTPSIFQGEGIVLDNIIREGNVVLIPPQTVLPVVISEKIKSGETPAGAKFLAKLSDNIMDNERHLLLSKDSVFVGKVLDSKGSFPLVKNGSMLIDVYLRNKDGSLTKINGLADCTPQKGKGRNFVAKDGQIIYVKLYRPLKINILTGEILIYQEKKIPQKKIPKGQMIIKLKERL